MTMNCGQAINNLGLLLDAELPENERASVNVHLAECVPCRTEYDALCALASKLGAGPQVSPPDSLWAAIERRLDADRHPSSWTSKVWFGRVWRPPLAVAALIALAVAVGMLAKVSLDARVEASTLDFAVLLDALPKNAETGFGEFLARHGARRSSPSEVKQTVQDLSFDVPDILPGGFHVREVYLLTVGKHPAVAATYDRDGEFLGAIFHREVNTEGFGVHKEYPYGTGQRRGYKVKVGEWKLVHLTDRTKCHCSGACHCVLTCQCVLSKLNEETELPAVLAAVTPDSAPTRDESQEP